MNIILYILFSLILFSLLIFLDVKNKINIRDKFIISILFEVVIGAILYKNYEIRESLFVIYILLMFYDVIYNSYIYSRDSFDSRKIIYYLLLIVVGYLVNYLFINKVDSVFLTASEARIIIWLLVFFYFYKLFKDSIKIKVEDRVDKESIIISFARLKNKFNLDYSKNYNLIIYSIMVYMNRIRPGSLRNIDNMLYRFNGKKYKSGIMQIEGDSTYSDLDSIKYVYKKISSYKLKDSYKIIDKYMGNNKEVREIYDIIKEFDK